MIHRSFRALVLSTLVLVACSSSDRDRGRNDAAVAPEQPVRAFVAHRDARVDAPSFLWLAKDESVRFADAPEAARIAMKSVASTFGLSAAARLSVEALPVDDSGRGPIVARFRQRERGIEIFRGGLAIAMNRSFDPVSASGFLARSLAGAERPFTRSTHEAVVDAYGAMMGRAAVPSFTRLDVAGDYDRFSAPGLAAPARVKKVLYPQDGGVVPAYYVEIETARGPAYSHVVSAADGTVLFKNDLVRFDSFSYRVFADGGTRIPWDGPQGNAAAPHPTGKPDGFKPTWAPTSLVTLQNFPFSKNDPWLAAGATTTMGNNVQAYSDRANPDGIGGDSAASLTGANAFDYAYDTAKSPGGDSTNLQASITQLFYVTNFLHDWYYDAGFDEKAGNHQLENFDRGGSGGDPLKAETQDNSGRNNANATVPSDGASPRLQMFVFSGPSFAELKVLTPAGLGGSKAVGLAGFGKDAFDQSGAVALANDEQGADAADACEGLTNDVSGKIVLVHRGVCSFVQKAQNVQAAGGIGVVVANVAASAQPAVPPFMGGTTSDIAIPILSLALSDGQALEAAIPAGATVQMRRELQTDLDGSLDTTIVAHEWGHVLSGRLVADGNGLTTNQAGGLGEGWGDFSGLLLMVRPDDVLSAHGAGFAGAYPNGAYATSGAGADFYFGIRRVPYSIDFTKNALTFQHIANGTPLPTTAPVSFGEDGSFNAEVHSTGEVWATMLWECYAALLRDPRLTFADAQDRMKRYYVASLKLTPPDPTLLEARDAVLAAAIAVDEKDYKLFWGAFARRGAGVGATGPAKDSTTNQGVVESYSVANDVQVSGALVTDDVVTCDHDGILDDGEIGNVSLSIRNAGPDTLAQATVKLSSKAAGLRFLDGDTVKLPPLAPFAVTSVKVRAQVHGAKPTEPIAIDVAVGDPSFTPAGRTTNLVFAARYQVDEAAATSAVDRFDTKGTSWTVAGDDTTGTTKKWSRTLTGLEGRWGVANAPEVAQQRLTSPRFTIDGTTFELAFAHRWSFRSSTRRKADFDGGVVEVSVDGGKTWKDIADYGATDYNTTLDVGHGDNVLKGRRAYGNKSPGYPDQWVSSRIKVDLKVHPEAVQVRFFHASGTGFSGAPGWQIAEVDLGGISSKPFWSYVAHADACDQNAPAVFAGESLTVKSKESVTLVASSTQVDDSPLTFDWVQVEGPAVALVSDGSPRLTFEAPEVGTETASLTFEVRANDGKLLSPRSRVDVTVVPGDGVGLEAGGGGCSASARPAPRMGASWSVVGLIASSLLALGVLLRRRRDAAA
jgi:hypothetical protein